MEASRETKNRTQSIDERYLEESLETLAHQRFYRLPRTRGQQQNMPGTEGARLDAGGVEQSAGQLNQLMPSGLNWKNPTSIMSGTTFFILYAIGVIPAGYLSWKCNSNHGFNTGLKMLFGVFAALGSWNYLLAYLFYKSYTCNPEKSVAYKKANVNKLEELMASL